MKVVFFILAAVLAPSGAGAARLPSSAETERKADEYYQNGNCVKSMALYRSIYHRPDASPDLKDLIRFRASYCYLELHQDLAAKKGFEEFLKSYPQHDEARLKFAEALFRVRDYEASRKNALLVKEASRRADALLLAAHSDMALRDYKLALYHLNPDLVEEAWRPVFSFWKGVAAYKYGDLALSRSYFQDSKSSSPPDLWTKLKSDEWLAQVESDLRWVHVRLSLGYFTDNNIGQASYLPVDSNGNPVVAAPYSPSYISDRGATVGAGLTFLIYHSRPFRLYSSFDLAAPYHTFNKAYANETLVTSMTGQMPLGSDLELSISPKYTSSKYDWAYYQNSIALESDLTWNASDLLRTSLALGISRNVRTRPSTTYSVSAGANYSFARASFRERSWSRRRRGATHPIGFPFSFGLCSPTPARLSGHFAVPLDLAEAAASLRPKYAPRIFARTSAAAMAARNDSSTTLSGELSRTLIANLWYLSAGLNYTMNRSEGFQGIPTSVSVAHYSYNRAYASVTTTLNY